VRQVVLVNPSNFSSKNRCKITYGDNAGKGITGEDGVFSMSYRSAFPAWLPVFENFC
jgi:hypothetical protein